MHAAPHGAAPRKGSGGFAWPLDETAAGDLPRSVRLSLEAVDGVPIDALPVLDAERLLEALSHVPRLAELEAARPVDGAVALANHVDEDVGRAEHLLDRRRGEVEGPRRIVPPEGVDLFLDQRPAGIAVDIGDCA